MAVTGVVVIGRNEGERLRRCLASVEQGCSQRVYVDSGSDDGSAGLARSLGWDVVELDTSLPLSAARGRNAGFHHLLRANPEIEFVQFVDGDCELEAGWLERAAGELGKRADVAVVTGRLRERHPEASMCNRLCDLEWNRATGEVKRCGGIFMARTEAFRVVGGFDAAVVAGEEADLCHRLREKGWRILHLDADMAVHDAALTRFGQWWRRAVRTGHAYAEGVALHGRSPDPHNARQVVSSVLWGVAMPAAFVLSLCAALWAPWFALFGAAAGVAYAVLACRIYVSRRRLCDRPRYAALYALFCVLAKVPQCIGIARFVLRRLRSRPPELIEHKSRA